MKEKVLQLKEKILANKLIAAGIALVLVLAVAGVVYAVTRDGDSKSASSTNASSGNLSDNQSDKDKTEEKDNSEKTTKKDDSTKDSETTKEGETTKENETTTKNSAANNNQQTENNNSAGNNSAGNNSTGNNTVGDSNGNTGNSNGSSGGSNENPGGTNNSSGGSNVNISSLESVTYSIGNNSDSIYNQLFDINNKVTIKMDISEDQLKKMESDYRSGSDTYRIVSKMTITIGNKSYDIDEVGVRIKGNTSKVDVYNGNDVNNRNLIHFRISFNETFDGKSYGSDAKKWSSDSAREARKNRRFAGLKGLELKWNRNIDGTYVANYYANQLYRAMGVLAQSTTLANVNFGGYNYGVYTVYEPVDEIFINNYLSSANRGGDLYKCAWGLLGNGTGNSWSGATYLNNVTSSIGVEADGKSYIYELKTNKKTSNNSALKNMISAINSNNSRDSFKSVVVEANWANFAAVNYFVGNPDDLRNNYNNHYVYMLPNGKAIFIPYDNDRCFGLTTSNKNMASYSPYDTSAALTGNQQNPLYKNSVIGTSNNYTKEYTVYLQKVIDSGWLNYSNYKKYYDIARSHFSNVAVPDSHVHVYVHNMNESAKSYKNTDLAFAETNSFNASVSSYITNIVNKYNQSVIR